MPNQYNIGVAIATYNGSKYIREQLLSILRQTIRPDLIVISDGGSIDNTPSICEEVLKTSGVKYKILTSIQRLSVKDNFQKCILACDSRYIFLCDQDDVWIESKISDYLCLVEKYKPAMIFSDAVLVDENLHELSKTLWNSIDYHPVSDVMVYERNDSRYYHELLRHNIVTGMCMMIDRSYLQFLYPFSSYAIHDTWISNIIGFYGKVIAYNKREVLYRQHQDNVIGTTTSIKKTYSNRRLYYTKLIDKISFTKDIISRCSDDDILKAYNSYINFLKYRCEYIEGKHLFISPLKSLKLYQKYNCKWKSIIIKDMYTRSIFKKELLHE